MEQKWVEVWFVFVVFARNKSESVNLCSTKKPHIIKEEKNQSIRC